MNLFSPKKEGVSGSEWGGPWNLTVGLSSVKEIKVRVKCTTLKKTLLTEWTFLGLGCMRQREGKKGGRETGG